MNWKKFIRWFTILGSIASLISVMIILIPTYKGPNLAVSIVSVENLTFYDNHSEPEIKAVYIYKEREITNLWKVTLQLKNTSDKTIVALGNFKNIIGDDLFINVNPSYNLIDAKAIKSDLDHQVRVKNNQEIHIEFKQWRINEKIEYAFYVQSEYGTIEAGSLFSTPNYRQIIDGNIHILEAKVEQDDKLLTDYLSLTIKQIGYVIALLLIGLLTILVLAIIFISPISFIRSKIWYANNYSYYVDYVREKYKDNSDKIRRYLDSPSNRSDHFWTAFKGDPFPDLNIDFGFKKVYLYLLVEIFLISLGISLLVVSADLIQQFP